MGEGSASEASDAEELMSQFVEFLDIAAPPPRTRAAPAPGGRCGAPAAAAATPSLPPAAAGGCGRGGGELVERWAAGVADEAGLARWALAKAVSPKGLGEPMPIKILPNMLGVGRSLAAVEPIARGSILFTEAPAVSCRALAPDEEADSAIPACAFCLRSLVPASAALPLWPPPPPSPLSGLEPTPAPAPAPAPTLRGSGEEGDAPVLPYPHLWPARATVVCERGCGEVYCDRFCRNQALKAHHRRLCPGDAGESAPVRAIERACRHAPKRLRGVHSAPILATKLMAATLQQREEGAGAGGEVGAAVAGACGGGDPLDLPYPGAGFAGLGEDGRRALRREHQTEMLYRLAAQACGASEEEGRWFPLECAKPLTLNPVVPTGVRETLNAKVLACGAATTPSSVNPHVTLWTRRAFEELLGRVLTNAVQVRPKSPFSTYYSAVRAGAIGHDARAERSGQILEVGARYGVPPREVDAWFQERCAVQGFAVFRLHSKHNHQCQPSAEAQSFGFEDHTIDIVALRDIAPGEAVTLSYVDPKLPKAERQRQLLHNHGIAI